MNIKRWWRSRPTPIKDEITPLDTLKAKCAEQEQSLKFTQDRFLCLMGVTASHKTPVLYEFHTTAKGIPVLLCIADEGRELKVYNINNNAEANCMLRLSATYFGKEASITNIVGGVRLGHGCLAVARFLELCQDKGVGKASVQFLVMDKDTQVELTHFFKKCGFKVASHIGCNWEMSANTNKSTILPATTFPEA